LGRPALNKLKAVPSTRQMKVKLPFLEGAVITIVTDPGEAKRCYKKKPKDKGRNILCHV